MSPLTDRVPLTKRARYATLAGIAILVFAVYAQSYTGRKDVVDNQQAGCVRGTQDRKDIAELASIMHASFIGTDDAMRELGTNPTAIRLSREDRLNVLIGRFMARASIDCSLAYPKASPLPDFNGQDKVKVPAPVVPTSTEPQAP